MILRHATPADADALALLEKASYPAAEGADIESIRARISVFPEHFWLLENDGVIFSFVNGFTTDIPDLTDAMYETPAMHDKNGAWQMIFSVVTAPSQRGHGYARYVLRAAIADAAAEKRSGLVLTCKEKLLPFYAQFGFIDEGISSSTHGDTVWHQMRLTFPSARKKQLRAVLRKQEKALTSAYLRDASDKICQTLLSLPEYRLSSAVFCFVGTANELQTQSFLTSALQDGKKVCVPLCVQPGLMEARQIASLSELSAGHYNIPEPPESAPLFAPEALDFCVVPCLACTQDGVRLGRGGGFYDRFLQSYSGHAVLICPEKLVQKTLPVEPHDICLSTVVTECGVFRNK